MEPGLLQKEKTTLLKKVRLLYVILFFLSAAVITLGVYILNDKGLLQIDINRSSAGLPHKEEVYKIINHLRYSGIQMFSNKDVYLTLDFEKGLWTLHNIHKFDDKGELVLNEGKYGTCGELAAYAADKLGPVFRDDYKIDFLMASQSGYFLAPRASHIVLRITSRSNGRQVYILDPSFRRYGAFEDFDDYLFFKELSQLNFMESKVSDIAQQFNTAIPLLIRGEYLLGFVVEHANKQFDRENFVMALTLNKKYNYSGRYLFALRYAEGDTQVFENKRLALETLSEKEWNTLKEKIAELFKEQLDNTH
ncbi:MAG: hypothetical protein PHO40_05425 [Candidatus Omnitrophica bacterium]|nr:hypothetical protein [Candidatus Omnitrophota bacterium]